MKILQTPEEQLAVARATIKRQEQEILQLRIAVRQLQRASKNRGQPAVNQHTQTLQQRLASGTNDASSSGSSTPATSISSSTTSNDSKQAPQRFVLKGVAYTYKNGKLGPSGPGYLRSTEASVNKFGSYERRRELKGGIERPSPDLVDWWISNVTPDAVMTIGRNVVVKKQQPVQIMSREWLDDRTEKRRLEIQTRLSDNAWVSERANNVWLDNNKTYEILFTAERLGKECFREWLRVNRPKSCPRYLSDVDFGRDWLTRFMDKETAGYRATDCYELLWALETMIDLRNMVHHFRGCCLMSAEEHLQKVQKLAVYLYDEEGAHAARALRDRLRGEAEEVARELETATLLTALPFTGDFRWKPNHTELFQHINWHNDERFYEDHSPAVVFGAMEWARRGSDVSWDCGRAVEPSLATVPRLEGVGCGSVRASVAEDRQGRVPVRRDEAVDPRWRSASANGPRRLRGKPAPKQGAARRGSFSVGEGDRSML
ncbi:hypothetical protein KVR01_008041 [Diaporthe batatas]|uniref:uncharacterized protein n=1 Tax=Diaporthe batatas TaxID=748121 RepID=UPI001D056D8C|nr:uncharacterized protein KVR01_008041 [Diaporthe batatas]KAG8162276.1 hypothetical protein KVR01_008041 [Diaporthe batatas]